MRRLTNRAYFVFAVIALAGLLLIGHLPSTRAQQGGSDHGGQYSKDAGAAPPPGASQDQSAYSSGTAGPGGITSTAGRKTGPSNEQWDRANKISCVPCHYKMGGRWAIIVEDFIDSAHFERGLTCASCHGGNPNAPQDVQQAMYGVPGFIGIPKRQDIPNLCAKCHADPNLMKRFGNLRTDQLAEYKTSVHGQQFFGKGDMKVATCTDCHTTHHIIRAGNPNSTTNKRNIVATCANCHGSESLMKQYGISATIPTDFRNSYHGHMFFDQGDSSAPVCTSCHSNHGAAPPGLSAVSDVCGTCHIRPQTLFLSGKHAAPFKSANFPGCITCHEQHKLQQPSEAWFSGNDRGNCLSCHQLGDAAFSDIQKIAGDLTEMSDDYDKLSKEADTVEGITHISMAEVRPEIEELKTALLTARSIQHTADGAKVDTEYKSAKEKYDKIKVQFTEMESRSRAIKFKVALAGGWLFLVALLMAFYSVKFLPQNEGAEPWQGKH